MLEFVLKEVWTVEKEELNHIRLFDFFLPDHRDALLVVNEEGKYCELITYQGLLERKNMSSYVVYGNDMFAKAYEFYDVLENRECLLPVLNTESELVSFFCWNAQIGRPAFRIQDCDNVKHIFISGCDEVNIGILKKLRDMPDFKEKQIFLAGEGWELIVPLLGLPGNCHITDRFLEEADAVWIKSGGDIDLQTAESYVSTYVLRDEFKSKRIFVYGANLNGQMILANLEFMGIHVHGIVDDACMEETNFMIWPIVKSEDIRNQPDVLVVCEGWLHPEVSRKLQGSCEVYSYGAVFQWNELLNQKKYVLLYESAHALGKVRKRVESCGGEVWDEVSVYELTEERIEKIKNMDVNLVFSLVSEGWYKTDRYCYVLAKKLGKKIYRPMPFLHRDLGVLQATIPFVRIRDAQRRGRKFVLYGMNETYSAVWQKIFRYLGIDFDYFVDKEMREGDNVRSVYDLLYEDTGRILLVLAFDVHKWRSVGEDLESMGFSGRNVLGMHLFSELILDAGVDIQLGHVMLCEDEKLEQYPGYHMYGTEGKGKYTIVTLGGSTTTDVVYRVKSWPRYLYDKLKDDRDIVIYNAAMDGFNSCQELMKLLRDVCALRPDLVISFSGVNDMLIGENDNPFLPEYLNLVWERLPVKSWGGNKKHLPKKEELRAFDFWYRMEGIMHVVSNMFGAKFVCFAQPIMYSQEKLTQERRWAFERSEHKKNAVEFRRKSRQIREEWFIDLTDILDGHPEVFMDCVHVDEEGNKIIADHIYHHIKPYL